MLGAAILPVAFNVILLFPAPWALWPKLIDLEPLALASLPTATPPLVVAKAESPITTLAVLLAPVTLALDPIMVL